MFRKRETNEDHIAVTHLIHADTPVLAVSPSLLIIGEPSGDRICIEAHDAATWVNLAAQASKLAVSA